MRSLLLASALAGACAVPAAAVPAADTSSASAAESASTSPAIHVLLHGVRAGGLAVTLAQALERQVAVGGYVSERVTLEGDFADADAVFARVAEVLHARPDRVSDILVLRAPCVAEARVDINPFSHSKAGLSFTAIEPVDALSILDTQSSQPVLHEAWTKELANGPLALQIDPRQPMATTYEAIVRATGTRVVDDGHGHVAVRHASSCTERHPERFAPRPAGLLAGQPCLRAPGAPSPAEVACDDLEWYSPSTIQFKGYVRWGQRRWAVVEMPDGLTWLVRPGRRLGVGWRELQEIGDQGVHLLDTYQDKSGIWQQRVLEIPYEGPI